jgi:hypothetical protein
MAKNDLKRDFLETTDTRAAVTGPEASDANKAFDGLGVHSRYQHACGIGEEMDGLEQLSQSDAERYDHRIDPGERGFHVSGV